MHDSSVITERIAEFDRHRSSWERDAASARDPREFSEAIISGLHPHQAAAIPTLDWLVMGGRATGRTHLLAAHIIRCAVSRPGHRFRIADHFNDSTTRSLLVREVRELLSLNPDAAAGFSLRESDLSIVFNSASMSAGDPAQRL